MFLLHVAIVSNTSAGDCIVSIALACALHIVPALHMICSTCNTILLRELCFAAAGCVQMTCHWQWNFMVTLAWGVDIISMQCSASRCSLSWILCRWLRQTRSLRTASPVLLVSMEIIGKQQVCLFWCTQPLNIAGNLCLADVLMRLLHVCTALVIWFVVTEHACGHMFDANSRTNSCSEGYQGCVWKVYFCLFIMCFLQESPILMSQPACTEVALEMYSAISGLEQGIAF